MDHRSEVSRGFLKPRHAKESNHENVNLDGKEAACSGHGLSTLLRFKKIIRNTSTNNCLLTHRWVLRKPWLGVHHKVY